MARIRKIKPEFFKDDNVGELEPVVRLLFIGLWGIADARGLLRDSPRWIKAELFPYDDFTAQDVAGWVDRLCWDRGDGTAFLRRYQVGERGYLQIVNFDRHQTHSSDEWPKTARAIKQGRALPEPPDQAGNWDRFMEKWLPERNEPKPNRPTTEAPQRNLSGTTEAPQRDHSGTSAGPLRPSMKEEGGRRKEKGRRKKEKGRRTCGASADVSLIGDMWERLSKSENRIAPPSRTIHESETLAQALLAPGDFRDRWREAIQQLEAHGLPDWYDGRLSLSDLARKPNTLAKILDGSLTGLASGNARPQAPPGRAPRENAQQRAERIYQELRAEDGAAPPDLTLIGDDHGKP